MKGFSAVKNGSVPQGTNPRLTLKFEQITGSGLGYGIAGLALQLFDDWRWAFRFTPIGGVACCLLLIFLLQEPKRGEVEGGNEDDVNTQSNYAQELKDLARNKT